MKPPALERPESSSPADLGRLAGLFLLATGGLFGSTAGGMLDDLQPAIAASAIFLLAFVLDRRLVVPIFFWGILGLALLSLLNPGDLRESLSLAGAAIAFLAGANLRDDDRGRRIILAGALCLGLLALIQRFILFPEIAPFLTGEARSRLASGRVFSAFILPAQYAAYGAMVLPLGWAALRTDRRRELAGAILLLSLTTLFMTGSISGIVAAAGALTFLVGPGRRAVAIVLVFLLLGGGIAAGRPDFTIRLTPVRQRLATWNDTLRGMADAPLLGHGAGAFEELYMTRYRKSAEADEVRHPHSWPVKIGFEHGAVGLAAFLLLWSALLAPIRDRSWRAAALAFGVAMLLDVADHSMTLRAFALFALGASLKERPTSTSRLA